MLIFQEEIEKQTEHLGRSLSNIFERSTPVMIGVLNGGFIFLADLIRQMCIPLEVGFVHVSTYENSTTPIKVPTILYATHPKVEGRPVVIVDDIVDTGATTSYLESHFRDQNASVVVICSLIIRNHPKGPIFYGFQINKDEYPGFIYGYGMDKGGFSRNLMNVHIAKDE